MKKMRESVADASGTKGNDRIVAREMQETKMEKLSTVWIKLMPGVGGRDKRFHGRPAANSWPIRVRCCRNHHRRSRHR